MDRHTGRFALNGRTRSTAGYVAGGALLAASVLAASALALSSSGTFLLAIAAFLVGGFAASYHLEPRGRGELQAERREDCGCVRIEQQYVTVEPSDRARLLGWGCAGVAAAGAAALAVLLAA
jgi:hypothetical protein